MSSSDNTPDPDGEQNPFNPFQGTPFEALFGGGSGATGMPDLQSLMAQMQNLMKPHDGAVNWESALDTARKTVAQQPDPSPDQRQKDEVADVVRLADHWLDTTTTFVSGVTSTAAWSRAEWVTETMPVWQRLVEPLAARTVDSLSGAIPEEARAMAGPILGMLSGAMGAMVATQIGSGVGTLAGEVLGASDVGLPLGPSGRAALLPSNVAAFAEGLDVTTDDVLLYLALREAAHQRLFANVGWLSEHLLGAVADYAGGMEVNVSGLEEKLQGLNPMDPGAMQEAMEGGLFELEDSPAQKAALERLEVTLALVEGWVDEVVAQATVERMPAATKLAEAMRRRRAAGGPAEQTFATTSAWSCALAGYATRQPCGDRCAPGRARRPGTACGCPRLCCPPPPISMIRWASVRTPAHRRRCPRRTSTPNCATCSTVVSERSRSTARRCGRAA